MSVLGKLAFWKKEEDPSLDMPNLGIPDDLGAPDIPRPSGILGGEPESFGRSTNLTQDTQEPQRSPFSPLNVRPIHQVQQNSEPDMLSTKLDTIRVLLENISARLARLEQLSERPKIETISPGQQQSRQRWG